MPEQRTGVAIWQFRPGADLQSNLVAPWFRRFVSLAMAETIGIYKTISQLRVPIVSIILHGQNVAI
jgi:hypothetical protein